VSIIPTGIDTNLSPDTAIGKVFTMFYLIVGTGTMLLTLILLAKSTINNDEDFKKTFKSGKWKREGQEEEK